MISEHLKKFLNYKYKTYNHPSFIQNDPISIPHRFTNNADREIAGFFAAIFAWGNRKSIIQKAAELMQRMDNEPHAFCMQHSHADLKNLLSFKHRTFNATDLLYFVSFFKMHYSKHPSLQSAFTQWMQPGDENVERALNGFYNYFFSLPHVPQRTQKHIACPAKKSACKRINMFLRWMVRQDNKGVDFGIWQHIQPAQLVIPLDVHVARVARRLALVERTANDWQTAVALTEMLKTIHKKDPVRYDFALFALGAMEKF